MRRNMLIMTVIIGAALALVAALVCGCPQEEAEDPAMALVQQAQRETGTAAPPTDEAEPGEPAAEADADEAPAAETGEDGAEAGAAEDEPAAEGEEAEAEAEEPAADGEDGEPAAEDDAVEEEEPAGGEEAAADEEPAEDEEPVEEEEPAAEEDAEAAEPQQLPSQIGAIPTEADEDAEPDEEAVEEEGETGDPVENFKNLDPRDIIIKKYEDLEERKTEPWNEESEGYIPNTGRVDPLTRVRSAVPDELKPPRAGETDMNEINTYLIADVATQIVDAVSYLMQCHNVIQIGLVRYATFSYQGGQPFPLEEGFSTSLNAGSVNGIPIIVTITLTEVDTDQVVLRINATGQGTSTSVTKNQTYIPRTAF